MPFSSYTDFDSKTLAVMSQAYDAALARLVITIPDPRTSELAIEIVALVKAGERDPVQLCDRAIEKLQK